MRYNHERWTNVYPQICSQRVINWFVVRDHWQICAVPFRFFCCNSLPKLLLLFVIFLPFIVGRFFFGSCAQIGRQKLDKRNEALMNLLHFHARKLAQALHFHCWIFVGNVWVWLLLAATTSPFMLFRVLWISPLSLSRSLSRFVPLISLWLLKRSIRLEYTYRNCELNIIYKHTTGEKKERTNKTTAAPVIIITSGWRLKILWE